MVSENTIRMPVKTKRQMPVRNAGTAALSRLAIGNAATTANPYAGEFTAPPKAAPPISNVPLYASDPAARALPPETTAALADPWAAADAGSLDTIIRKDPPVTTVPTVPTVPAATPAGAPALPAAVTTPKVNPLTALYEQLFADLGKQQDVRNQFWTDQNASLSSNYDRSLGNQQAAFDAAMRSVANGVNPYAQITTPASTTTGNPLQAYMEATGVDPSQVNALIGLNSANNAQYDNAVTNTLAQLGAAYDQANASRVADLNVMNAGFQQDIDAQRNALAAQMASQQAGENANFDQRRFDAGQSQIADNQAFDTNDQNRQMSLFQNILSSYGDALDPQSLVNLVTAFARATGANPASLMPTGSA